MALALWTFTTRTITEHKGDRVDGKEIEEEIYSNVCIYFISCVNLLTLLKMQIIGSTLFVQDSWGFLLFW